MLRAAAILSLITLVSGCVGPPKGRRPEPVRATGTELKQCLTDLSKASARYDLLANQNFGSGCSAMSSVRLTSVGVPISNVAAIQCPLALTLTRWSQNVVQPAAKQWFGQRVIQIESFGAYSCRNVIGRASAAGNRSEHATANAVDIGGFILADGRRMSVKAGWAGTEKERGFLRQIRAAACQRFQTVLSPDYNAAHNDHLHFDMGRGPFCR
jgi:hypothetical protein